MMTIKKIIAALILVLSSLPLEAEVKLSKCIQNIDEILPYLPADGQTIAVFDWDQTLNGPEGQDALREKTTLTTLQALHKKGVKTILLIKEQQKGKKEQTDQYVKPLGQHLWLDNGALKTITPELISLKGEESKAPLVTENHVVFVPNYTTKGQVLAFLIDKERFKAKPTNIFYINHSGDDVDEVGDVFMPRPEQTFLFHYPNVQGGDQPCSFMLQCPAKLTYEEVEEVARHHGKFIDGVWYVTQWGYGSPDKFLGLIASWKGYEATLRNPGVIKGQFISCSYAFNGRISHQEILIEGHRFHP